MAKWFEDAGIWYNLDQYVAIWITPGKDLVGELPNGHTNIILKIRQKQSEQCSLNPKNQT